MQRLAALLFTSVSVLAQQVAIEGHWTYTTSSDFNKQGVQDELAKVVRAIGNGAVTSVLAHEDNGLMLLQVYESESYFADAFNYIATKSELLNKTNQFLEFTSGTIYSQDFVSGNFSQNVSDLFGAERSQMSQEFFESQYQFGPPVRGWINHPLSVEMDMIFQTMVFEMAPGANEEVTEIVQLMTDFMLTTGQANKTVSSFQA